MAVVYARRMTDGSFEDIEVLLGRFRKEVEKDGILIEWKKHEYFKKPSALRHEKMCEIKHKNKLARKRDPNEY